MALSNQGLPIQQIFRVPQFHRTFYPLRVVCRAQRSSSEPGVFTEWMSAVTPTPGNEVPHPLHTTLTFSLIAAQGAALIGAIVGGTLARRRRRQLETTNEKLRRINAELRRRQEESSEYFVFTDGEERAKAIATYRSALERSVDAPSAAHPTEECGSLKLSLARARRRIEETIREAKLRLRNMPKSDHKEAASSSPSGAIDRRVAEANTLLQLLDDAAQTARDVKDPRAERAVIRLRARARRLTGDLMGAKNELLYLLQMSGTSPLPGINVSHSFKDAQISRIPDSPEPNNDNNNNASRAPAAVDLDLLGELGDVLTEMGDFEAAGKAYDACIASMDNENGDTTVGVSTWDVA